MLNENIKYEDELSNLMSGLADSVLEMSDEEIEEEINFEGDDSEDIRQVLLYAVKACRQEKLIEAKKLHQLNLNLYQNRHYEIPDSPDEKRNLIQSMLGNMASQNQSALTLQHRDYEDMPDEDLDGFLHQLFALKSIQNDKD